MFKNLFKKKEEKVKLNYDAEIKSILGQMAMYSADSEEYAKLAKSLESLVKLKEVCEKNKKKVDPNQVISVLGSLAGILAVLNYERLSVITGKAWSLINKIRV